jgi:FKBP-type peptidyl-prolyl cis-trans isomerase 2
MSRILIFLIILSVGAGCLGTNTADDEGRPKNEIVTPKLGEVVRINYIVKSDGIVFDTTDEGIAKGSPNYELLQGTHPFGFEPLNFILGSDHVDNVFNEAVLTMELGGKKTFNLPAEKSIGKARNEDLIQVMPRHSKLSREGRMPNQQFRTAFGFEPEVGKQLSFDYWNSSVIKIENETTTYRHNPVKGSSFEFPGGNISITFDDSIITLQFIPQINKTSLTKDGRFITVISSNESHMLVDYNHPLAGKTTEMEITLQGISKPISWTEDFEEGLQKSSKQSKPVFTLFRSSECEPCLRIEKELLTHPLILSLKEDFIWVKIDTELQSDIAKEHGTIEPPKTLIHQNGVEVKRIANVLPPEALRAVLESILE